MKLLKGLSSARGTKRALIASAACTLLCGLLLFSTSVAWFSADRKSGANELYSGNLDIELFYSKDMETWSEVKDAADIFKVGDKNMLWEPGAVNVVYFKIENKGSLAAKYDFALAIENEVEGTNFNDQPFKLSDYIKGGVVENITEAYANRTDAITDISESEKTLSAISGSPLITGKMDGIPVGVTPGEKQEKTFALVLYMPNTETNNEETNYKTESPQPKISLNVKLVATQMTGEADSFGDKYDIEAPWMGGTVAVPAEDEEGVITINSAEELAGFANSVNSGNTYSGKTIKLGKDIDLNNVAWTPVGNVSGYPGTTFAGTFDGQGHTISNLRCKDTTPNYASAGLFGSAMGTIKNLTLTNVDITSSHYAGAVVGYSSNDFSVENCHVKGGTIKSAPERLGSVYDNGDKVGGINGYSVAGSSIKDCSVEDLTITAYRDIGGIVGATSGTIQNNTVKNVTIIQDNTNAYKDSVDTYHEIIGRDMGATSSDNTFENVTLKTK